MAERWSNDNCEVILYKDIHASTLAVDCVGIWALLAGRKSLAFVDLRDTDRSPIKVTRQSKWDIGCVQWNRHAYHAHRFVTACNQRLDVFDLRDASASHLSSLKAHSRTVSDVDWSPFDVNIVASCSVDTFTYMWDVRDSKKPVKFFQTVSGAYQVKWNKVSNNLFATTHDGDVRIWDPRKENSPIGYISAHPYKIHGLDWSHSHQYKLVTASQDGRIRFWDYQNPRDIEATIDYGKPVWRARYTPFGVGVMSMMVPQLRRGENNLYLWSRGNPKAPVHTFVGHQDVILEFQWRKQEEGVQDHQLVTWSKDQSLRLWKVDPSLQKLCGHETDDLPIHSSLYKPPASHKSQRDSTPIESKPGLPPSDSIDSLGNNNSMGRGPQGPSSSVSNGSLQVSSNSGMDDTSTFSNSRGGGGGLGEKEDRQSMLEKKYKVEKVKPSSSHSMPQTSLFNSFKPMFTSGNSRNDDDNVPFPRTCGATFCSNDFLVVFSVPSSVKRITEGTEGTPRCLSDLVQKTPSRSRHQQAPTSMFSIFGNPPPPAPTEGVSISDFFTEKTRKQLNHKPSHGRTRDGTDVKKDKDKEVTERKKRLRKVARIQVYNVSAINPVSLYLAKHYKLDMVDYKGCCEHNAKVASKIGRKDLVQLWTMISHMCQAHQHSSTAGSNAPPWAMHPFGRALAEKYLSVYEKQRDVQTMAMIACMFWDGVTGMKENWTRSATSFPRPDSRLSLETTNVQLEALASSVDSGWEMLMNKGKQTRSLSASFDDNFNNLMERDLSESDDRVTTMDRDMDGEKNSTEDCSKMLNPELRGHYEQIKKSYADLLYKWGLLNQRTQILKHTLSVQGERKIEFSIPCSNCYDAVLKVQCNKCHYPSLNCSICHVGVRGPANVCLACGHGGHSSHMMKWFHTNQQCPSGCGCNCLQEASP